MHIPVRGCSWLLALAGVGCLVSARAAGPAAPTVAPVSRHALPPRASVPALGPVVDNARLASLNAGTETYETVTLNGNVSNTSTTNVVTGLNEIGGGAFANAAGFPMVIQNTGNSVLIQNATIINVQMQP